MRLPGPGAAGAGRALEYAVAAGLTLAALGQHARLFGSAGGLWRDEANSVATAGATGLEGLLRLLPYDSAPPLYYVLLGGWMRLGPDADGFLRALGAAVGVLVLAALWHAAHHTRRAPPLLALALVGLNPVVIRWGDSLRPYGLGAALAVWTFACFWRACREPGRGPLAWAAVAAVLSVHCAYQNLVLLAAVAGAAVVVCFRRGLHARAGALALVAAAAAVSAAPILLAMSARRSGWGVVIEGEMLAQHLVVKVARIAAGPDWLVRAAWAVALAVAVAGLALAWRPGRADLDLRLFGVLTAAGAAAGTIVLLAGADYTAWPWRVLPLLVLVGAALEAAVGWSEAGRRTRWAVAAACAAVAALQVASADHAVSARFTTADLVARRVARRAGPQDLLVVSPWQYAVSFRRYYDGPAPLITVPPLADHAVHRYDLAAEALRAPAPLEPLLRAVEGTLSSGHRVFWVRPRGPRPTGGPTRPPEGQEWPEGRYGRAWAGQLEEFLARHVVARREAEEPGGVLVDGYESLGFEIFSGWRQ